MGSLVFRRFPDVDAFLAAAGGFLARREAEHNLLFGISSQVRLVPDLFGDDPPRFGAVLDQRRRVVAATLRTPPYNQVLSCARPEAVDVLAEGLDEASLPGVTGPKAEAARFVERWRARAGVGARLEREERIYRLERVVPPARPASGAWRMAEPIDRRLVAGWLTAFAQEATPGEPRPDDPLAVADRWIAGTYRRLYLWEDGGAPVSMVGVGGATPNGIRVGPVYTPPESRGRGYASALTAAASQHQLDQGRRFVFLFTDLANPTSNRIYRAIGYEPVIDVDLYRFEPPSYG